MSGASGARRGDYVLVVGAAHIDVIADYASARAQRLDKIGSVRYSVGGTAYNIAINLGQSGVPVQLATVLRKRSFSSVWIRTRLGEAGVGERFVQLSDAVGESGFVALRRDGHLESAVTSAAVEQRPFTQAEIDRMLAGARLVVLDCNLPTEQLQLFVRSAQREQLGVAIAAVSDSKVVRLAELQPAQPITLASMNEAELLRLGIEPTDAPTPAWCQQVCRTTHANNVIVSRGPRGHWVVQSGGRATAFAAPDVDIVESPTGAGDALLAGTVAHWFEHQTLDFRAALPQVQMLVGSVLRLPGATRGALAVEADFARLARVAVSEEPWLRRMLTQEFGVALTVLGVVLGGLQVWYAKRSDDKVNASAALSAPAASAPPLVPATSAPPSRP